MKNRLIFYLLIGLSTIAVIVVIINIEYTHKTPVERYMESLSVDTSTTASESISSYETTVTKETLETMLPKASFLNPTRTIQYSFISFDLMEDTDIPDQDIYSGDFFFASPVGNAGELPDPDYLVEYTDYKSMRQDYPEVDEYISSNGLKGMTEEEYYKFMKKHLAEYTKKRHPKTKYLFVRCKITNVSSKAEEECINNIIVIAMHDRRYAGNYSGSPCYFDHEKNIENDGVWYKFDKGESIECTLGFPLIEDYIDLADDNEYYVGFAPVGVDDLKTFDPSIDDGFVNVCTLPKEI